MLEIYNPLKVDRYLEGACSQLLGTERETGFGESFEGHNNEFELCVQVGFSTEAEADSRTERSPED